LPPRGGNPAGGQCASNAEQARKAAIEAAAKEYKIADALRDRLIARRDEL
jgi:hypothetical protein